MTFVSTAKKISAHLRRQGLFTSVYVSPEHPLIKPENRYAQVGVYRDKKKILIVGAVVVHPDGHIECKGDPALKELIEP